MSDRIEGVGGYVDRDVRNYLVAAAMHQVERVRYFVETRGLHPDSTLCGKPTALCYAVLKPHPCLMKYLFHRGADVRRSDQSGMTPLHYAALGGSEDCLGYLICCGAEVNQANRHGDTPLSLTLMRRDLAPCREFLLRCGATCADEPICFRRPLTELRSH